MLSNFRSFAQSPAALVIIVLLVLAFAIALPGSGGIFTGSGDAVVTVGSERISQRELAGAFNREVQRLQEQYPDLTREEAREQGLGNQVLQQQITLAAYAARARELGLDISATAIVREVSQIPAFRNPATDRFDRDAMVRALRGVGISEDQFAENIENDLLRSQFIATLAGLSGTPSDMAATRFLVTEEQRRMTALILDASTAEEVADPTEDELTAYVAENFTRPEFRAISLVRFQLQDYIRNVEVDESFLRETYEYELATGRIGSPVLRSFDQLTVADAETAEAVAARINAGDSPAAVARELGLDAPLVQTDVQISGIPDAQLGEAVFTMGADEAAAIEGRFGWNVVRVTAAEEAVVPSFEDERERLQGDAARAQATDDLYDAIERFETARQDGASLEVAAQGAGIPLEIYQPLSATGYDENLDFDLNRYQTLVPEILPAAFDAVEGFAIDLQSYNQTDFFTLRVDRIIPSRPFELDEVREEAETGWRSAQVDTQLRARADEALAQLQAGDDMELVTITAGGRTETSTLNRTQTAVGFDRNVVGAAFSMAEGEVQLLPGGNGRYIILTVNEIIPGDIATASDTDLTGLSNAIDEEVGNDILQATREYLVRAYGITDESVDARLFALAMGESDPLARQ